MNQAEPWRTTVVDCLDWTVAALGAWGPTRFDAAMRPVAVFVHHAVVATNHLARRQGVVAGLRRREAQRRAPELLVCEADPDLDQVAFTTVLRGLDDLTPRVTLTAPGWCSFLTRGPARYFGGEEAMGQRAVALVQAVLDEDFAGGAQARAATAGSLFAARCGALRARPGEHLVVAPGQTPAFLAAQPLAQVAESVSDLALVEVFARLGIATLGDLAALSRRDVLARFGTRGATLHTLARGETAQPPVLRAIPTELSVAIDLDPPVLRVDQGAFVAKSLAEEFCAGLSSRGSACDQVAIELETVTGERLSRLWRAEGALDQAAIAQRMRWQLDGWLNGPRRSRPSGGLSRIVLRPDQVIAATGRQMGLWGEASDTALAASRAVTRLRAARPDVAIWGLEPGQGRSVDELVRRVAIDSVDLVERHRRHAKHRFAASVGPDRSQSPAPLTTNDTYLGAVPFPYPAVVADDPIPIQVFAADGETVTVQARGQLDKVPVWMHGAPVGPERERIEAWAGPWLLDERWWDPPRHRRSARFQFVTETGVAVLAEARQGLWWVIGIYR